MEKSKVIVTPNYRDPKSRAPWLVYDDKEPKGRAVVSIVAIRAEFVAAPVVGWGASDGYVVRCDRVEEVDGIALSVFDANGQMIRFNERWYRFVNYPDQRTVVGCERLFFRDDRKMVGRGTATLVSV